MLNDDTHAQHICNSKRVVLFRVALFLLNACLSQNLYISSVFFPITFCNNTCTSFSKCYIIKQLLTRSILVLSGRYHIISNASLVNNCILNSPLYILYSGKMVAF